MALPTTSLTKDPKPMISDTLTALGDFVVVLNRYPVGAAMLVALAPTGAKSSPTPPVWSRWWTG